MTNRDLPHVSKALTALGKTPMLPGLTALAVARAQYAIQPLVKTLAEAELRMVDLYATKDAEGKAIMGEGGTFTLREDVDAEAFGAEMQAMMDADVPFAVPLLTDDALGNALVSADVLAPLVGVLFAAPEMPAALPEATPASGDGQATDVPTLAEKNDG